MIVNRGPAKGCVWPVIAPAEGIVRAGAVLRGDAVRARGCVRPMPVVRLSPTAFVRAIAAGRSSVII